MGLQVLLPLPASGFSLKTPTLLSFAEASLCEKLLGPPLVPHAVTAAQVQPTTPRKKTLRKT
jgi:hypothetical protein